MECGDLRQSAAVEEEEEEGEATKVDGSRRFAVKAVAAVGGVAGLVTLILCSAVMASQATTKTMQPQLRRTTDYYRFYAYYDGYYTDYDGYYADSYGEDAYADYYESYSVSDPDADPYVDYAGSAYGEYYSDYGYYAAAVDPDAVELVAAGCILPPMLQREISSIRVDFKSTSWSAKDAGQLKGLLLQQLGDKSQGIIDSQSGIAKYASVILPKLSRYLDEYHGTAKAEVVAEVVKQLLDAQDSKPAEEGSERPCGVDYGYYLDYYGSSAGYDYGGYYDVYYSTQSFSP